jgi:hypothetical protein
VGLALIRTETGSGQIVITPDHIELESNLKSSVKFPLSSHLTHHLDPSSAVLSIWPIPTGWVIVAILPKERSSAYNVGFIKIILFHSVMFQWSASGSSGSRVLSA